MTPLSLGEGTVFKPNGEYVFRADYHFLSASSRPILFKVMSPVFFNTSRYNTLRWVALQLPELKCVATAVSFLSRTSERCMFILFLKESPVHLQWSYHSLQLFASNIIYSSQYSPWARYETLPPPCRFSKTVIFGHHVMTIQYLPVCTQNIGA